MKRFLKSVGDKLGGMLPRRVIIDKSAAEMRAVTEIYEELCDGADEIVDFGECALSLGIALNCFSFLCTPTDTSAHNAHSRLPYLLVSCHASCGPLVCKAREPRG